MRHCGRRGDGGRGVRGRRVSGGKTGMEEVFGKEVTVVGSGDYQHVGTRNGKVKRLWESIETGMENKCTVCGTQRGRSWGTTSF